MLTPKQSLFVKGSSGDPLPVVWDSLDKAGTRFLQGQLVLICAGPGVGKSAFTLAYAVGARVPTLYFSADSDAFTQLARMVSILTGMPMSEASSQVRGMRLSPEVEKQLDELPIQFKYDASPTLDQIEEPLEAFIQKWGDYPALVVVDNITNIRTEQGGNSEDPFAGLEVLMDYLHTMARQTGACVIGLHHVKGEYNDSNKPIPMSGVKGQIGRVPELVLTLHRIGHEYGPDELNVSTVKNRGGKADASGWTFVTLDFDGDNMSIKQQKDPSDLSLYTDG